MIDEAKKKIITNWELLDEDSKYVVVRNLNKWLSPYSTKISLLMRVKLQNPDGSFVDRREAENNAFYNYYIKNNGENIYEVITNFSNSTESSPSSTSKYSFEIDQLFNQLNMDVQSPTKLSVLNGLPQELEGSIDTRDSGPAQKDIVQSHDPNVINGSSYHYLMNELKLNSDGKDDIEEHSDKFSELLGMLNK